MKIYTVEAELLHAYVRADRHEEAILRKRLKHMQHILAPGPFRTAGHRVFPSPLDGSGEDVP